MPIKSAILFFTHAVVAAAVLTWMRATLTKWQNTFADSAARASEEITRIQFATMEAKAADQVMITEILLFACVAVAIICMVIVAIPPKSQAK